MEINILEESKILARDYSELKLNTKKWQLAQIPQVVHDSIKISKEPPQTVQISRDFSTVTVYLYKSLERRFQLRRNPNILKSVLNFWNKINPFNLAGISEKVYRALFTLLYSKLIKDSFDSPQIERMVKHDQLIDFAGRNFLPFPEFYDSVFELIDTHTNSKLLSEYCHFSNQIINLCEDSGWSDGLNLYSKIHIDGKSANYTSWMKEILKHDKKKTQIVPKMLRSSPDVPISPRLLNRKKLKPVDRENFNIRKLEKIMSEKILKRKFKAESPKNVGSGKRLKIKLQDRKAMTFYSNYIDKISPLSSMYSVSRGKNNILENVISGRKNLKEDEGTEFF